MRPDTLERQHARFYLRRLTHWTGMRARHRMGRLILTPRQEWLLDWSIHWTAAWLAERGYDVRGEVG